MAALLLNPAHLCHAAALKRQRLLPDLSLQRPDARRPIYNLLYHPSTISAAQLRRASPCRPIPGCLLHGLCRGATHAGPYHMGQS